MFEQVRNDMAETKQAQTHTENNRHQKEQTLFKLLPEFADRSDQLVIDFKQHRDGAA